MCKKKQNQPFGTLVELIMHFDTEKKCLDHLVASRWGDNIQCTKCGSEKIYKFKDGKRYKCGVCGNHFTALVGTMFQDTKTSLRKWFIAMYLLSENKKGISTRQLALQVGVSVPTAWFMLHRIRQSLGQNSDKMTGAIASDETFVGGKNKNRHADKKVENSQGRSFKDKTPVVGLMSSDGELRCKVVRDTSADSIQPVIEDNVEKGSIIVSDEWIGYNRVAKDYDHQQIDHRKKQYVNDCGFTTNSVECAWSHLKRMVIGCYHQLPKKHLHRYVDEFTFRYNMRSLSPNEKMSTMLKNSEKSLPYKKLIAA